MNTESVVEMGVMFVVGPDCPLATSRVQPLRAIGGLSTKWGDVQAR